MLHLAKASGVRLLTRPLPLVGFRTFAEVDMNETCCFSQFSSLVILLLHVRRRHASEFDPIIEVFCQSGAPRGHSIVVVRPIGSLAVLRPNDRYTVN